MAKNIVSQATDVLTEVIKGAAVGAVIGAVDAGVKAAGFGSENKAETNAAKATETDSNAKSLSSKIKTSAIKKTGKS